MPNTGRAVPSAAFIWIALRPPASAVPGYPFRLSTCLGELSPVLLVPNDVRGANSHRGSIPVAARLLCPRHRLA